jgi:hypothetical protein
MDEVKVMSFKERLDLAFKILINSKGKEVQS